MSLFIFAIIIILYVYIQHNNIDLIHSVQYVTTTTFDSISCGAADYMLCSYLNGLNTIFNITDRLRNTSNQSHFDSILNDIVNNADNKTIVYNTRNNSILLTPSYSGYPFGVLSAVKQLISNYGQEICEQTNVNETATHRIDTRSCRGWVYIDNVDNVDIKQKASLSLTQQNGGYAILFGSIVDFDGDKIYYLHVDNIRYQNIGCESDDALECNIMNAQMLLGNALFFVSTVGFDYYPKQQIWDAMTNNSYFQYSPLSYKYYVFVNRYIDGYRYVHGEVGKINTNTSINNVLRIGADTVYGEWIEYERSSGEQKRSYIIPLYPDVFDGWRLYIGSGYSIVTSGVASGSSSDVGIIIGIIAAIIIIIIFVIIAIYLQYNRKRTRSVSNTDNDEVEMSETKKTKKQKTKMKSRGITETTETTDRFRDPDAVQRKELLRLSKVELVKKCKKQQVPTNGSKADLVNRLVSKKSSKPKNRAKQRSSGTSGYIRSKTRTSGDTKTNVYKAGNTRIKSTYTSSRPNHRSSSYKSSSTGGGYTHHHTSRVSRGGGGGGCGGTGG